MIRPLIVLVSVLLMTAGFHYYENVISADLALQQLSNPSTESSYVIKCLETLSSVKVFVVFAIGFLLILILFRKEVFSNV